MDFLKEFFSALKNDIAGITGETVALGDNPITTLNIVLWSLYIGFVLGIIITIVNRLVLGGLIKSLVDRKVHTEADAITIEEAGCKSPFVKLALRNGGTFRRVVKMVGDTDEKTGKADFASAKFYIPEDNVRRAEVIYGRTDASVVSILLSIVAFFIVMLISFKVVPQLIGMLSNFLESIKPGDNIL